MAVEELKKMMRGYANHGKCVFVTSHNIDLVAKLFDELATKYESRNGGYTRIIKIKERVGDDALTVKLELV